MKLPATPSTGRNELAPSSAKPISGGASDGCAQVASASANTTRTRFILRMPHDNAWVADGNTRRRSCRRRSGRMRLPEGHARRSCAAHERADHQPFGLTMMRSLEHAIAAGFRSRHVVQILRAEDSRARLLLDRGDTDLHGPRRLVPLHAPYRCAPIRTRVDDFGPKA